jgi:hypothetical protein
LVVIAFQESLVSACLGAVIYLFTDLTKDIQGFDVVIKAMATDNGLALFGGSDGIRSDSKKGFSNL